MLRMTLASLLSVVFVVSVNAQQRQNQNQNLFPGEPLPTNPGQIATDQVNSLYNDAQRTADQTVRQVNDAAQQTIHTTATAAQQTAKSWTRFLKPQPSNNTLIDRWNAGTKSFLEKTKQVLTPPAMDKPLIALPNLETGLWRNVKLPSLSTTKKRSLLPAILSRESKAPAKPKTVQDYLAQPRPEW